MDQSVGDVAVAHIDFMMKYEKSRARESTREHYGKRGMYFHGGLVKYCLNKTFLFSKEYT